MAVFGKAITALLFIMEDLLLNVACWHPINYNYHRVAAQSARVNKVLHQAKVPLEVFILHA